METAMEAAFEKVGKKSPEKKLNKVLREALNILRGAAIPAQGHEEAEAYVFGKARRDLDILWPLVERHVGPAIRARLRELAREDGKPIGELPMPAPIVPPPAKVLPSTRIGRIVAKSIMDSFYITERQGSVTAIGDIPIAAYPSYIRRLGKTAWVRSREYMAIYLLNTRIPAHVPDGSKTRDIFDDATVKAVIAQATDLAAPKLPEGEAAELSE